VSRDVTNQTKSNVKLRGRSCLFYSFSIIRDDYTEEIVKSNQMNIDALQNLPPAANNSVPETQTADAIPSVTTQIKK